MGGMELGGWAVLISVLIAGITAVVNIFGVWFNFKFNTRHLRRRTTFEFISAYENDSRVSRGHDTIRKCESENLKEYLKPGGENLDNFYYVMNKFEILAAGIKHGVYDKKIVTDMLNDDLRRSYKNAKLMADYIRGPKDTAFRHWEEFMKSELSVKIK